MTPVGVAAGPVPWLCGCGFFWVIPGEAVSPDPESMTTAVGGSRHHRWSWVPARALPAPRIAVRGRLGRNDAGGCGVGPERFQSEPRPAWLLNRIAVGHPGHDGGTNSAVEPPSARTRRGPQARTGSSASSSAASAARDEPAGGLIGRRTVTMVPTPSWLLMRSAPPWSAASEREIASPRPEPL